MNKIFLNNIGDLGEAQRASFFHFLSKGISEELATFSNPILTKIKVPTRPKNKAVLCKLFLHVNKVKLKGPLFNTEFALKRDITYAIQLFVPGEYTYIFDENIDIRNISKILKPSASSTKNDLKIKKIRVKQDIFLGELPLMTEEGTFIINGYERIVISQIIRSPGLYFRKELVTPRKTVYTATLISDKGLWTKFILDEKINKQTKRFEKDRIYLKLNEFKAHSPESKEKKEDSDQDKIFIYDLLHYYKISSKEIYDNLKHPLLFEAQQLTQESKKSGEFLSQKEKLKSSEEIDLLLKKSFFNSRNSCFSVGKIGRYRINKKLGLNLSSNLTNLTGRDLLGIIDGLIELKYYDRPNDDIDHIKHKQIRPVGELLQNQFRTGLFRLQKSILESSPFTSKPLKINLEMGNLSKPNDWVLDPRPLTAAMKEFFKASQLSQFMDQINPLSELTHRRKISVFGPNGLKRDRISTVIRDIHPSQYGKLCPIETPEGQSAGLMSSIAMFGRVSSLGWIETPYFAFKDESLEYNRQAIFLDAEQESKTNVAFADICLNKKGSIISSTVSTKNNYSFLVKKSKDVNFITTSPLQIMSLAAALIPFIEHDDANRALMGSNMQRQAVPLIYSQKPIVGTGVEPAAVLDSGFIIKAYSAGRVLNASSNSITIADINKQQIHYFLRKFQRSNQETSINQRPIVWPGEIVFSGQIIADGPSTNDGELALGKNLIVAYMPWEGYNYEDAIVINERLVFEDTLTSLHIEEYETCLGQSALGSEKLTSKLPFATMHAARHLDGSGIVKIGSYVYESDVLVGKLTPCEEDTSPEAKLLKALYGQKKQSYRDTSLCVSPGTEGRVVDIRIMSASSLNKNAQMPAAFSETIRIYIAHIRKIKVGDKLAGRHGNKGVISRILARQDMPHLPDGTPVDIILNPLGVPSRMNVGQIFECLLGLAGAKLGKRFKVTPFDEIFGEEASRVLINQKLKEAAIKTKENWIFNSYSPGKVMLQDGRTGEYFDNPITVGKSYILKLVHLVEEKIHARATGPYSMIAEQPLAGKSQRGGQRFGEMEVWALEAYGCANTLQELLTVKSDDIDGRNDMHEAIIFGQKIKKPMPTIPEAFLALIRELHALGLDFSAKHFQNNFYSTAKASDEDKNIFKDLEIRLKLRALGAHKKIERNNSF
uniref:DNA-directed RNA polymerase subunit beta n=1 Tax=Pedospumella sp. Jangsampo120217C5 TaxID=2782409 RepID=A0A7S6PUZ9_9STRA|nr:RNA polymerase beta subunit [Pedospumella sp. Jangsampo120217C5]